MSGPGGSQSHSGRGRAPRIELIPSQGAMDRSAPGLVDISSLVGPFSGADGGPWMDNAEHELDTSNVQESRKNTVSRRREETDESYILPATKFKDFISRSLRSKWRSPRPIVGPAELENTELRNLIPPSQHVAARSEQSSQPPSSLHPDHDSLAQEHLPRASLDLATAPMFLDNNGYEQADQSHDVPEEESHKLMYTMSGAVSDPVSLSGGSDDHAKGKELRNVGFARSGKFAAWQPWELTRRTLLCFVCFYIVIMAVLGILFWASQRNQGLGTSVYQLHYLWTYGPTAVLTIASIVWHRVDYRVRQMQPWKLMATGPTSADHGLLLDYISPMLGINLYHAVKNWHGPVILSILIDLFLKLLIILSTSFLVLQTTLVREPQFLLLATSKFSGENFDLSSIGVDIGYTVGSTGWYFNTSFPAWTQNGSAIQPFNTFQPVPQTATVYLSVDAFVADLGQCETGQVVLSGAEFDQNPFVPAKFTTPSCSTQTTLPYILADLSNSVAGGQTVTCSNSDEASTTTERFLLYVAAKNAGAISNMTFIICSPSYSIETAAVAYDGNDIPRSWDILPTTNSTKLPGVNDIDVMNAVAQVINVTGSSVDSVQYDLLQWQLSGDTSSLFDMDDFLPTMRYFYSNAAAQVASSYMMQTSNDPIYGEVSYYQQRVVVRQLALDIMEPVLILLLTFTMVLILIAPRNIVPCDPGSIGGLSTILATNEKLASGLTDQSLAPVDRLRKILSPWKYQTMVTGRPGERSFGIHRITSYDDKTVTYLNYPSDEPQRWWKPIGVSAPVVILSLISPLLLVAALETVLQLSQKTNGISNINPDSDIHYVWVYIPALIMVLLGMVYTSFVFATRLTHTYLDLKDGRTKTESTILHDPLKSPALFVLWRALRFLKFTLALAGVAALVAPLLTIAVSGLYAGELQSVRTAAAVSYVTDFNSTFHGWSPQSTPANFIASLLQQQPNLSYPQWTYDTLVLPQIELDLANIISNLTDISGLEITVPALQGKLSCQNLTIEIVPCSFDTCVNTTSPGVFNRPYYPFQDTEFFYQELLAPANGSDYFGMFTYPGCWEDNSINSQGYLCDPTLPYGIAYFGYGNSSQANVTALICEWPVVQQIQTDVTLEYPSYTIDTSKPPKPDYSTATTFSNQSFVPDISHGRLEEWGYVYDLLPTFAVNLDTLMTVAVHGRHSNSDALTYLDPDLLAPRVEYAYNFIVAQYLSHVFRIPAAASASSTGADTTFIGHYTNANITRLVQSPIATRILEGLLAVLFLCALSVHLTVTPKTRRLLPKDPGSIAAMASMLAGSHMLSREVIPSGSEWLGEKGLRREGVFEGYTFSMGWWGRDNTSTGTRQAEENDISYKGGAAGAAGAGSKSAAGSTLDNIPPETSRFGIDVGKAWWPDDNDDDERERERQSRRRRRLFTRKARWNLGGLWRREEVIS